MKCSNTFKVGLVVVGFSLYLFGNTDTTLADMFADSVSEFSGTQGQDNWYYGYYTTPGDSSSWEPSVYYDPLGHEGPQWNEEKRPEDNAWGGASVTAWGGWPNYNIPQSYPIHWSVRRWISEVSGEIIISGTVAEWDTVSHGDGVNTIVYVDGVEVWSNYVPATPGYAHTFEFTVHNVVVGSLIDFAIDPIGNSWYDGTIFTAQIVAEPILVTIDIKPGSDPNPINPGSNGLVPVAIFSSPEFDATQVDPTSVSLAGASVAVRGKGKSMAHEEDVNGDGLVDLVVQVETQGFDDLGAGGIVELTGTTFGGEDIVGYDEVVIVPPE